LPARIASLPNGVKRMRVIAEVHGIRLKVGGEPHSGWLPPSAAVPLPTPVREIVLDLRIEELERNSFLLIWDGEIASDSSDSWHQSLEDAMTVAEEEFGVRPVDWNLKSAP
jgi:hypothetical protein